MTRAPEAAGVIDSVTFSGPPERQAAAAAAAGSLDRSNDCAVLMLFRNLARAPGAYICHTYTHEGDPFIFRGNEFRKCPPLP